MIKQRKGKGRKGVALLARHARIYARLLLHYGAAADYAFDRESAREGAPITARCSPPDSSRAVSIRFAGGSSRSRKPRGLPLAKRSGGEAGGGMRGWPASSRTRAGREKCARRLCDTYVFVTVGRVKRFPATLFALRRSGLCLSSIRMDRKISRSPDIRG